MIPLSDWAVIAGLTVACAVAALTGGLLLMRLLRNRSVVALLLVASCSAVATVTGAVLVTTRAMFLSEHDSRVVLVCVALSIISAVGVALVLASSVRGAARSLAVAAVMVGDQTYGTASVPTRELRTVALALNDAHVRLVRARAVAQATEDSRRQLVAGMSHDLRTPLAGMRAMVESLEDHVVADPESVDRYHHQLRVEIDRISAMVNDLFELSRVEGPMQLRLERVGAGDLVEEALASADPVARAKGIRLIARTSPDLPVTVDPDEFGRVMRNLLLNAIRHTPNDGTIAVTATVSNDPVEAVSFTVSDACGGIPDDDLPRVFETAFRGNTSRTTGPDHGGGYGLAIARSIVEAHRGEIVVANHGLGCLFEVRLPPATS
jgi:signal transduction histidine kinase